MEIEKAWIFLTFLLMCVSFLVGTILGNRDSKTEEICPKCKNIIKSDWKMIETKSCTKCDWKEEIEE